jgi:hypothetical protein
LTCIAAVADGYVQQGPKDPPQTEKWTGMYFGLGIDAAGCLGIGQPEG